jgi:hypothetical protein
MGTESRGQGRGEKVRRRRARAECLRGYSYTELRPESSGKGEGQRDAASHPRQTPELGVDVRPPPELGGEVLQIEDRDERRGSSAGREYGAVLVSEEGGMGGGATCAVAVT